MAAIVILLFIIATSASAQKFWKHNASLQDPANWDLSEDCEGFVFAEFNTAPIRLDKIETSQLVLPIDGELIVEDSIVFNENKKKCNKFKPINFNLWFDYRNWVSESFTSATPHLERIPCRLDTAIFPPIQNTRVFIDQPVTIWLNQLILGDREPIRSFSSFKYNFGLQSDSVRMVDGVAFYFGTKPCENAQGCVCHDYYIPCPIVEKQTFNCLNPIQPENFCSPICGAAITFEPSSDFQLVDLKKRLLEYEAKTHVSRISDDVIQVIVTEDEFTGQSLDDAHDFMTLLKSSNIGENYKTLISGQFYQDGRSTRTAFGLIFGTLAGVATLFAIVFYIYSDGNFDVMVTRLRRHRASSLFTSPFFARFNNTDEDLIIEGQSMAGSIVNLAKSFDNPLYGQSSTKNEDQESEDDETKEE